MLISHLIANEYTAEAEEKRQYEISFIKNASDEIKKLLGIIDDKETRKQAEKLYDALYSSPVKSHPNLIQMEERIIRSITELVYAIAANDKEQTASLLSMLLSAVNERNARLKLLN